MCHPPARVADPVPAHHSTPDWNGPCERVSGSTPEPRVVGVTMPEEERRPGLDVQQCPSCASTAVLRRSAEDDATVSFVCRRCNLRWSITERRAPLDRYAPNVGEADWSPDGRRLVYQTGNAGDPMFVHDLEQRTARQILVSSSGVHNHFPVWSPDGAFIYFVRGFPPDQMDIWRIGADPRGRARHIVSQGRDFADTALVTA
jgi:WD40-like Beta Propeller Repeat